MTEQKQFPHTNLDWGSETLDLPASAYAVAHLMFNERMIFFTHLSELLRTDPRGIKYPEFIDVAERLSRISIELGGCWEMEKSFLLSSSAPQMYSKALHESASNLKIAHHLSERSICDLRTFLSALGHEFQREINYYKSRNKVKVTERLHFARRHALRSSVILGDVGFRIERCWTTRLSQLLSNRIGLLSGEFSDTI